MIIRHLVPQNSDMETAAKPTPSNGEKSFQRCARGFPRTLELIQRNRIIAAIIGIYWKEKTMQERLLRRREVERITGMSRSSIYRLMQEGKFPRPVRVGPAAVRWRASDITAWIESRPVATGEFGQSNVR